MSIIKRGLIALTTICTLAGAVPDGAGAQGSLIAVEVSTPPSVAATTPTLRFALLEERVAGGAPGYDVLWATAREGALLAASLWEEDERKGVIQRARGYAEQAVAQLPSGIEGHYWLAATSGMLADEEGGRTKIRLAQQAWEESSWVLERDPAHAGAHHIQGRLHAAVMRLNRVLRFLARQLIGGDVLAEASWAKAEFHLRRAVELAPEEPVHHLELGFAYLDLKRTDEARSAFRAAASAVPRYPADHGYMARAEDMVIRMSGITP